MTPRKHDHLDSELLVALERGSLDDVTRAGAQAHLDACGRCQAELELLRQYFSVEEGAQLDGGASTMLRAEFQQRLRKQVDSPLVRGRSARLGSPRFWARGALVAASLALIVVAASQLWDGFRYSTDEMELRATEPAQWAAQLEVLRLDGGELRLQWPGWPGVEVYRVLLLDSRGDTVFEAETSGTKLSIDRSELTGLSPDGLYFAVVELTQLSGEALRSAPRALPSE